MPPENGPVHIECSIMRNFMASATEAELGGLFEKCQKATSMRMDLVEMGHQRPPTPVTTDNTTANSIINGTAKRKRSQAIDMMFYRVRDIIRGNHFRIFWEEGEKNLVDYVTKHHTIFHHRAMRPRYVKAKNIYIENLKYRRTGTGRRCDGTTNPGRTGKPDNPLKGIQDLVQNGTWSQ